MKLNDRIIRVCAPEDLAQAVKAAAAEKYLSASAYIRKAMADQLVRDGYDTKPRREGS